MNYDKIIILCLGYGLFRCVLVRRGIQQPRAGNHPGWIGQPGGIPEGPDLTRRLVARTRTAVEVIIGWRIEEQGFHHVHRRALPSLSSWLVFMMNYYKRPKSGARP